MPPEATEAVPIEAPSAPAAEPAAPAAPAAPASTPAATDVPKSMLEAVQRSFARDEQGRFTKAEQDAAAAAAAAGAPAAPAAAPAAPAAAPKLADPAAEDDITKMPDGLGAKAQERFQKLANGIKERDEQLEQARSQLTYVQQTFQQNGVRQEQFEQAVSVIGMLNKGDYRSALQVLDEQRRQIALALGEPLPGVDVLADYPDLREKVAGLQMSEADAAHVASLRRQQQQAQQQRQQMQAQSQQAQAEQHAIAQGTAAVDAWAKRTAATDLDYPAIEKLLLPRMQSMLEGVPPAQWARIVQAQYEMIKESGAVFRRTTPPAPAPDPLRPAGMGAGKQAPSSMEEAMWGRRLTA